MASKPFSLVRLAFERLHLSVSELANLLGCSEAHVRRLIAGDYAEHLNAPQMRALMGYVRLVRDRAIEAVAEMETLGG